MNNLVRGLIAGYGAKKLGGGCFSTILIFVIIWYLLGHCGNDNNRAPRTRVQNVEMTTAKPLALRN